MAWRRVIYGDVGSLELSEMDQRERVERVVDIYESADAVRVQDRSPESTVVRKRGSRCSRLTAAAWCLGLLCVLLLISNILLYMHYVHVKRTIDSSQNVTAEKEASIRNLTEERDQLKISYQNLIKETIQLNKSLTEKYLSLKITYEKWLLSVCQWTKFGRSFYYISTEQKNWNESRQFCRERGGDLVIINSKEEQEFINKENRYVWIGLSDAEKEGEWKWVDGSPLTVKFWKAHEPSNTDGKEDCAVFTSSTNTQKTWNDIQCSRKVGWICEFTLTYPKDFSKDS